MPTPFDALDADISAVILAHFGESEVVMLRPWARAEFAEGADQTRPARPIRGVFTAAPRETDLTGRAKGARASGVTDFAVVSCEFWVPAAEVTALPYAIRTGDRIQLTGRAGAPVYSVSVPQACDTGDINLLLALEDGA